MRENAYLWTHSRARLYLAKSNKLGGFNWLFLPGGPGLGSESLLELVECIELPGNLWLLDFPGDGSNIVQEEEEYFCRWHDALDEATRAFENVILVAHSTGGMYALATPELARTLTGLVLMSSAPNASWQESFQTYMRTHPVGDVLKAEKLLLPILIIKLFVS